MSSSRNPAFEPTSNGGERVQVHDETDKSTDDAEYDDEDEEDMDYEPAIDEESDDIFEDDLEDATDGEVEFDVSADVQAHIDYLTSAIDGDETTQEATEDAESDEDGEEEEEEEEEDGGQFAGRTLFVSRSRLMRLLGNNGLRLFSTGAGGQLRFGQPGATGEGDDDDEEYNWWSGRRRRRPLDPTDYESVPNHNGRALMMQGTFGNNERRMDKIQRAKRMASKVLEREIGGRGAGREKLGMGLLKQDLIPQSEPDLVVNYNSRCYSGQFSADGNFFFTCGQDFKVRMYDTSNPYDWKYYKTVEMPYGQWTITDASLSTDNRFLAYTSISNYACLASTDPYDSSPPRTLDFSNLASTSRRGRYGRLGFGIWSIRFSGDGRELVAGTGDNCVYVYDIERNQSVLRIPGHTDDVNAVCFGDPNSQHILYSGSDDTTLKVWDRRSMGDGVAAGVFLGHTEGLTYVDSKGDGRYIISNGKDQTAKLWDLRKVISTDKADTIDIDRYTTHFDYRDESFDRYRWKPHPHDCSLVTFRGHAVLRTLIRCHFSPPGSTDGRYVYSGSHDGKVYIWNLDATLRDTIDVKSSTSHLGSRQDFRTVIRDASWHPVVPMIAATSWNGRGASTGTCTVHSWNEGLSQDESLEPGGRRVNARLVPQDGSGH